MAHTPSIHVPLVTETHGHTQQQGGLGNWYSCGTREVAALSVPHVSPWPHLSLSLPQFWGSLWLQRSFTHIPCSLPGRVFARSRGDSGVKALMSRPCAIESPRVLQLHVALVNGSQG